MVRVLQWTLAVNLLCLMVSDAFAQRSGSAPLLEPLLFSGITGQIKLHNRFVAQEAPGPIGITTPFRATVKVYSANTGRLIRVFNSDSAGRFAVPLPPSRYRIVPQTMKDGRVVPPGQILVGGYQRASPLVVRVLRNRFEPLKITYEQTF